MALLSRVKQVRALAHRAARDWPRALRYLLYRSCLLLPVDRRLAVYSAFWANGYGCNPAAVYEKARELAPHVRGVWVVKADRAAHVPAGVDYVIEESARYFRVMARAKYLVSNANFPDYVIKRPGSVEVQTHHGTPLKKMGMDGMTRGSARFRRERDRELARCRRWDFSISANPHSTEAWHTAYPAGYETLEYGYPRNDVLVNAAPDHGARVRESLGIAPGQRVILYTPTHRGRTAERFAGHLDVAAFAEALGSDTVILLRTHYFYEEAQPKGTGSARVVDVTDHPNVADLYLAADVLITDYSSTMFDFAVLDRPIAVYAPDWDEYVASRGVYFDILAEHPGVVATTQDELVAQFRSGAVEGEAARTARAAFRERFCALEDGRASERVVRRVMLGEHVVHPAAASAALPQQAERAEAVTAA